MPEPAKQRNTKKGVRHERYDLQPTLDTACAEPTGHGHRTSRKSDQLLLPRGFSHSVSVLSLSREIARRNSILTLETNVSNGIIAVRAPLLNQAGQSSSGHGRCDLKALRCTVASRQKTSRLRRLRQEKSQPTPRHRVRWERQRVHADEPAVVRWADGRRKVHR